MKYALSIFLPATYHHKNQEFLEYYKQFFNIVDKIDDADIVFSSNKSYSIEEYPDKKFVFGPHFSVLPNTASKSFRNKYNNAIYIHPSKSAMNVWKNDCKYDSLPLAWVPFGVDTDIYVPGKNDKTEVIIYFKRRDPEELAFIEKYLNKKGIKNYKVFRYGSYKENAYIKELNKAAYVIWVGRHESQGFALQEALSMNVPVLVWNTSLMSQEYGCKDKYNDIKSPMETIPYWDVRCGEFFYKKEDFPFYYDLFLSKLKYYKPRDFIVENLSFDKCRQKFDNLLEHHFGIKLSTSTNQEQPVEQNDSSHEQTSEYYSEPQYHTDFSLSPEAVAEPVPLTDSQNDQDYKPALDLDDEHEVEQEQELEQDLEQEHELEQEQDLEQEQEVLEEDHREDEYLQIQDQLQIEVQ